MKRSGNVLFFCLLSMQIAHASVSTQGVPFIKDEFDISSYWKPGMTWQEFRAIRNKLERPALIKYVDKIEQQRMALKAGIEVPRTYIATRDKVPVHDVLAPLSSYVAKCTHLSKSKGLVIVKNGLDMFSLASRTPQEVEQHLFDSFESKPREVESWALHQVNPGFMVQEYIPNRTEAKILTIWGRVMVGELRSGENQRDYAPLVGKYDRKGKSVYRSGEMPFWWPEAVKAAEILARGTDALRVDFLVREDGTILLNEMEIWCEHDWSVMLPEIEARLNEGYRRLTRAA